MTKRKTKVIITVAAVLTAIAVLLAIRLSLAYLIDAEVNDNIITIGNVSLKLDEGEFKDSSVIAAGDAPPKAPRITNTGINDEYVFLRIAVPVREVTLLYESDVEIDGNHYKQGTPTRDNYDSGNIIKKADEIYRTIADGHDRAAAAQVSADDAPNTPPQLEIGYNKGDGNAANDEDKTVGWAYLYREKGKKIDGRRYDFYYFGYNRRLKYEKTESQINYQYEATVGDAAYYMTEEQYAAAFPSSGEGTYPENIPESLKGSANKIKWTKARINDSTIPLFDRIQLKSFIDEELVSVPENTTSKLDVEDYFYVTAYGIQADSLGISEIDSLSRDAVLSDDQLRTIFGIVERKAGDTP